MKRRRRMVACVAGLPLLALLCAAAPQIAQAKKNDYSFTLISTLGDPLPGGNGTFVNDYEPSQLTNGGDMIFGADVSTGGEGIFVLNHDEINLVARSGDPAPGTNTVFSFTFFGPSTLLNSGTGAFAFALEPFSLPVGVNGALYRIARNTFAVTPVVFPGVTVAPESGGQTFAGVHFGPNLDNRGDLVFGGIVPSPFGIHVPGEAYTGLALGLYQQKASTGQISAVVIPGDDAPGGGTFDVVSGPWVNARGDIAFTAHVAGEECKAANFSPQAEIIGCLGSIYLWHANSGDIDPIAHAGDPAPGGGTFRQTDAPVMNERGDIAFLGDLTPPPNANRVTGVYLHPHTGGPLVKVAAPGDDMPGGGHMVTASIVTGGQLQINNPGDIVFNALLDTDVDNDGVPDMGVYVWSKGVLRVVARTGTVIPGVGTVKSMTFAVLVFPPPEPDTIFPNSGAINNERGQVGFGATVGAPNGDVKGVLLLATP